MKQEYQKTLELRAFKLHWREFSERTKSLQPSIEQQRADFDAEHGSIPIDNDCVVEHVEVGNARGERIVPKGANSQKALLYHHGGGYVFGSALSHRHLVARLAKSAGAVAYNMNYRLAPEHPFPGALEDALESWRFVLTEGFTPSNIVIGGDSAGGNLTAALLLKIRELDLDLPAGAYLLSPWLDLNQVGESYNLKSAIDPMVSRDVLQSMADMYRAMRDAQEEMISPVKADLSGLPPLLIQVGADEVLLSDSLRFTTGAALAGVDVQLHVYRNAVHAWPLFHHLLPTVGREAILEAGQWIARTLDI